MEKKPQDRVKQGAARFLLTSLPILFLLTFCYFLGLSSVYQQTTSNVEEMMMKMVSMTQQLETLQYKIQQRSEELNPLAVETYEWTIKDVTNIVSQDQWRLESEVFRFIGYKYDIKAMFDKTESGIRIFLQLKDGDTINKFLNKFGFTRLKLIVKSQGNNPKEKSFIFEIYLRFDDCFNEYRWVLGHWLPDAILSPPYIKDDCLNITILFEPPSIDRSFVSNNGILIWKVDNYKQRKVEQFYNDTYTWSPSFYTSTHGYRVKTRLLINCPPSTAVEVHFLTGEHDDSLSIDYPHKTTITLYNHIDPSKNMHVKSEQHKDVGYYTIQLESSTFIEDNGFVKDDSILLKVVIEPGIIQL